MITLTSDFGLKDPYVAEMKGVILAINPKATIIDISHEIEKFNIRMGAFVLASSALYFPEGTIHLAVVDPEVGTQRRGLIVKTKKGLFVGPDNGVLTLAASSQGIEHTYQIENPQLMLPKISTTFHGRDIFAPAAAYLDKGVSASNFGQEINDPINPEFAQIKWTKDAIIGEVLHIDSFGNIITNISEKNIMQIKTSKIAIKLRGKLFRLSIGKVYAEKRVKRPVALIGSHGFLEIALNRASASEELQTMIGDEITVKGG